MSNCKARNEHPQHRVSIRTTTSPFRVCVRCRPSRTIVRLEARDASASGDTDQLDILACRASSIPAASHMCSCNPPVT